MPLTTYIIIILFHDITGKNQFAKQRTHPTETIVTCCIVANVALASKLLKQIYTGWTKKSVFSKNENRPWWGFFEKKIHDQ